MSYVIEEHFMAYYINDTACPAKLIDAESLIKKALHQDATDPVVSTPAASEESVNFSSTSKQLEALKASLQDIPEINEARIAYFKAEIQAGTYQVNSSKIAQSMLNDLETA